MKQTIKIDGRCWCPQCGHYYDYKEMADEKTCQECVYQTREFQKVDLKRLLESMPDEDIDEIIDEIDNEILRDDIIDEIVPYLVDKTSRIQIKAENLADRIIKLI